MRRLFGGHDGQARQFAVPGGNKTVDLRLVKLRQCIGGPLADLPFGVLVGEGTAGRHEPAVRIAAGELLYGITHEDALLLCGKLVEPVQQHEGLALFEQGAQRLGGKGKILSRQALHYELPKPMGRGSVILGRQGAGEVAQHHENRRQVALRKRPGGQAFQPAGVGLLCMQRQAEPQVIEKRGLA